MIFDCLFILTIYCGDVNNKPLYIVLHFSCNKKSPINRGFQGSVIFSYPPGRFYFR